MPGSYEPFAETDGNRAMRLDGWAACAHGAGLFANARPKMVLIMRDVFIEEGYIPSVEAFSVRREINNVFGII